MVLNYRENVSKSRSRFIVSKNNIHTETFRRAL